MSADSTAVYYDPYDVVINADPYDQGWLVKLTGGGETVDRDEHGHTAMDVTHHHKYRSPEHERG